MVVGQAAIRVHELRAQFNARGAAADDDNAQRRTDVLRGPGHLALQEIVAKVLGLRRRVQKNAVRCDTRYAKVIAHAAHRQNKRVIANLRGRSFDLADPALPGGKPYHLTPAIEAIHAARDKSKMIPFGLSSETQRLPAGIQNAGRHFMQQRLPDMREAAIHERDLRPGTAKLSPQRGCQFEAACAAAYDDYSVRGCVQNTAYRLPVTALIMTCGIT